MFKPDTTLDSTVTQIAKKGANFEKQPLYMKRKKRKHSMTSLIFQLIICFTQQASYENTMELIIRFVCQIIYKTTVFHPRFVTKL